MSLDFDIYWHEIQNGKEAGLEQLYRSAFKPLVYYGSQITGNTHQAEEVVQDVLLRLWQNRSELVVKGSFRSYLFRSVHNHALNIIRQQKTRKESVNILHSEKTWKFISDTYDINDNMIDNIISDETEAIIDRIIKDLPDQCRKVFILSRFESLRNNEIAAQLGLSENTVKTHIYRALQKIASALGKDK